MANTVPGTHLGLDTHANRPAANTAPDGSFYSCSTHSLIYKSNYAGNSWATWASLTGTGLSDPMTTRGDIIIRDAANAVARLGRGAAGTVLTSDGTDIAWAAPAAGLGAWQTYTPAWTSSGSAPAIGDGTLSGRYRLLDASSMQIIVLFVRGAGSTNGTGNYTFSMPGAYKGKNTGGLPQILPAILIDSGTANFAAIARLANNSTTFDAVIADATGVRQFAHTVPITLATSDSLSFSGIIEYE